jgi:hypothetical protein
MELEEVIVDSPMAYYEHSRGSSFDHWFDSRMTRTCWIIVLAFIDTVLSSIRTTSDRVIGLRLRK